jgi:hypothetical protein
MTAVQSNVVHGLPSKDFMSCVSHDFARMHLVLSAGVLDGTEQLLVAETTPR